MTTMKSMWRLSPEERRHDWYKRHHRLAENLFAAPFGVQVPTHPQTPHLDGYCAPKNAQGMIGWAEPWNHSAWIARDWVRLADTGRWWPDTTATADCPICLGPCGYPWSWWRVAPIRGSIAWSTCHGGHSSNPCSSS